MAKFRTGRLDSERRRWRPWLPRRQFPVTRRRSARSNHRLQSRSMPDQGRVRSRTQEMLCTRRDAPGDVLKGPYGFVRSPALGQFLKPQGMPNRRRLESRHGTTKRVFVDRISERHRHLEALSKRLLRYVTDHVGGRKRNLANVYGSASTVDYRGLEFSRCEESTVWLFDFERKWPSRAEYEDVVGLPPSGVKETFAASMRSRIRHATSSSTLGRRPVPSQNLQDRDVPFRSAIPVPSQCEQ